MRAASARQRHSLAMHDTRDTDSILADAETLLDRGEPETALERLGPLLAKEPDDIRLLRIAGRAFNNAGRLAEAAAAFRKAASADPEDADSISNLGHVLARMGDQSAAEAAWTRALALVPGHLRSLKGLAGLLAAARRYEEAVGLLHRVAEAAPTDPDNWLNLAELLQFMDRSAAAEAALREAAGIAPDRGDIHAGLGRLLYAGGQVEAAECAYRRALECDPQLAEAAAGRALCLEVMGQPGAALDLLLPFLSSEDGPPVVDFAAGRVLAAEGREEEALMHLQRATRSPDPGWRRNPMPWYAMGAVLERLGRYDSAFDAWIQANRLKPARFEPAEFEQRVDRIIHWHDAARVSRWPPVGTGDAGTRPLFIVGMPRSGTTLVEQVLACHPRVRAGGERLFFETLAAGLWKQGQQVGTEDDAEVGRLRARWLEEVSSHREEPEYFTDKFPGNFMHLGLVRRILPEAVVIWCRRDPADTALSIFANDFNRRIVPWATRLENIAVAWTGQRKLMEHWSESLGLPLLAIDYEALVTDFEAGVRKLLDFLGLPWDPSCLDFYRSGRLANTASFDQVRRPVYASSVGRHRRFERRLSPFLEALGS